LFKLYEAFYTSLELDISHWNLVNIGKHSFLTNFLIENSGNCFYLGERHQIWHYSSSICTRLGGCCYSLIPSTRSIQVASIKTSIELPLLEQRLEKLMLCNLDLPLLLCFGE